ncbi:MAG TPA: SUMF1/EgtB/PvdO family nonheme iron enzyme [Ktedonobacterales bacterium]|nr:SUMF1/EgtB/PvdO family nonheme iron enzyme [Ktedonobacterales bacterium]
MMAGGLPGLLTADLPLVRAELLRRAALGFERAGQRQEAAECWLALGLPERASELYIQAGQLDQAAETLLHAGAYAQALKLYQTWEQQIPAANRLSRIRALLGQAACHILGTRVPSADFALARQTGQQVYEAARAMLSAESSEPPLLAAQAWAALGAFGGWLGRYDLVQEGYEQALERLATIEAEPERQRLLQAYLTAANAQPDRLLRHDLEARLAAIEQPTGREGWGQWQAIIERWPFRAGRRDVLHFTQSVQWTAWVELASLEGNEAVDDYLGSLAPEGMVYIPAGRFLMGSADDDPEASDSEHPQHELWLRGYYLDRFPVTNAQYQAFIDAGGYAERAYWTEAGWEMKEQEGWQAHRYREDTQFNGARQPVVGVSWYEAVAYASWAGKVLPSEAEWEKAATWDPVAQRKRCYPWGDEWDEDKCCNHMNSEEKPVDVGTYKEDTSAYGIGDMAGNNWEWCSTLKWRPYPYKADDGRENMATDDGRISKGTSWDSSSSYARGTSREYMGEAARDNEQGFRCLVPHTFSQPDSEFR